MALPCLQGPIYQFANLKKLTEIYPNEASVCQKKKDKKYLFKFETFVDDKSILAQMT